MPIQRPIFIAITKTEHINRLYQALKSNNYVNESYLIDLSEFNFIFPIDVVMLSQSIIFLANNGCRNIRVVGNSYVDDIGIVNFCNRNYDTPQTINEITIQTAMPIKRVERSNIDQYIIMVKNFLQDVCVKKDLTILNIGLSELINNVYDHSKSPVGAYVFCQHYPKKKTIRFAVSDLGLGIPNTVNNYMMNKGEPVMSSSDCIQWAFERKKTVHSTPRNAGLGLNNVMNFVTENNGSIRMLSGSAGMYKVATNDRYFVNPLQHFHGTVVDIEINVDNLHEIDEEERDFDI